MSVQALRDLRRRSLRKLRLRLAATLRRSSTAQSSASCACCFRR
jgi:hypothetical protein